MRDSKQPKESRWLRADYFRYTVQLLPERGEWAIYDWLTGTMEYTPDHGQDARRVLRWPSPPALA